ncbi:Predicted dehydrogenase [Mesorhizobium albiziae]|uniref:Predicted dehydrogenase n=1 Tax=Neomesorhizobium albiziae TaxID=335020 RepID=A0A1I4FE56_9HYPH|nr:Gfo/Idh/MocA family oxidoreductase [Mesorhizobium albiziae]GLS29352.1 oxidoreductase [Mesorhizobium albiziae]SFL16255.1 Predicted dehydrogenase [Mesorhizobium albiziae]
MQRLLLLGTGGIATHHLEEFAAVPECEFVACADAAPGRAAAFAKKHGIANAFDSLDEAIAWGEFDAAVNATPDGVHMETTLALLAAGKHVFCEKPLAQNYPDAMRMVEAAESAGLINMVNLTYRNSPALQQARQMVAEGRIGALRHVNAEYLQSWLVGKYWGDWRTDEKWLWRLSRGHGSTGVLGDVGVHILDFATYCAGEDMASLYADLAVFAKAEGDRIGDYALDANDSIVITGRMASGALATVTATRYATGHANDLGLTLSGTEGAIRVETDGKVSKLSACLGGDVDENRWRTVETPPVKRNARRFADALISGRNGDPSFRRAAEIQKLIDAAFESGEKGRPVAIG